MTVGYLICMYCDHGKYTKVRQSLIMIHDCVIRSSAVLVYTVVTTVQCTYNTVVTNINGRNLVVNEIPQLLHIIHTHSVVRKIQCQNDKTAEKQTAIRQTLEAANVKSKNRKRQAS